MPIVFVHGVNNRKENPEYSQGVDTKRSYFESILAPRLGLSKSPPCVEFPYWGGQAVKFRWNQASVPRGSDDVVALGRSEVSEGELWLAEARYQAGKPKVSLSDVSRNSSFVTAVDLVWDIASAMHVVAADEISHLYEQSLQYAQRDPSPVWAMRSPGLSNEEFVQRLIEEARKIDQKDRTEDAALGLSDWIARLKEAAKRLGSAPGDAISSVVTGLGRSSIHASASQFLGDIFVYLSSRDATGPDSILSDLIAKLRKAQAAQGPGDGKLIVVGHSLGGLLAYDTLTHYAPDITVDHFITVGSQVALFEEMTLCRASQVGVPANPPGDRLDRPKNIRQWINVYDTNDVFSFRAEAVFKGVEDYRFDTGYGLLQAHGGYFARPSFYRRLASRLART